MLATYIRPEYMEGFRCDGRLCGSRCCREWSVAIDPVTYEKYAGMEPKETREEICGWISGQDDKGNFLLQLREDKRCPFLREDSLCRIQREHGEEFLSDICFSYPRVTYRVGHTAVQALSMSCPVAARLLLAQPGPLRLRVVQVEEKRKGWHVDMSGRVEQHGDAWQDLQAAGIWLLQDRRLSLDRCLFSLLCFYGRAEEELSAGTPDGLRHLLEAVEAREFSPRQGAKFQREEHVRLMMELYHGLYGAPSSEKRLAELLAIRDKCWPSFGQALLGDCRPLFENYLANEFLLRFYPYAYSGTMERNARIFILAWKVMEFALLMMWTQGGMDFDRVLLGIGCMTDRLDHSKDGMRFLRTFSPELYGCTAEEFAEKLLQ